MKYLVLRGRKLLSEGEGLGGKLRLVKEHPTNEQRQDTSRAHFTAAKDHHERLESEATAP